MTKDSEIHGLFRLDIVQNILIKDTGSSYYYCMAISTLKFIVEFRSDVMGESRTSDGMKRGTQGLIMRISDER